nr:hypothetical protein [Tanacetum cinerariifolium]
MLHICPRLPGQRFKDPPLEEEILSFIRDLGHTREIMALTDVNVNYMHQPWRSFAAIINRCLSGKTTSLDSLCLSYAQILWGMYHKKNADYVYLLWENLDQSISRRNKMFWHNAKDDPMFNTIRVISRHQDTHVYSAILLATLTNQEMLDSKAYKEYYAVAYEAEPPKAKTKYKKKKTKAKGAVTYGAEPPKAKPKYKKKTDESVTSLKSKTASASKGTRLKSKAKVTKLDMKKKPAKKTKAKGLAVLFEVALSEAEQVKLATKRSKKDFHISHANEGTGTIPWVPNVPPYESESDKESWGDSEDEDDKDDDGDDDGDNDDDAKSDDHDDVTPSFLQIQQRKLIWGITS